MSKLIIGPPRSGLTSQAVEQAANANAVLVVATRRQVAELREQYRSRLAVITYEEFLIDSRRCGTRPSGYVIDDLTAFAQYVAGRTPVVACTVSQPETRGNALSTKDSLRTRYAQNLQMAKDKVAAKAVNGIPPTEDLLAVFYGQAYLWYYDRTYYPGLAEVDTQLLANIRTNDFRFVVETESGMQFRRQTPQCDLRLLYGGANQWLLLDGRPAVSKTYFVGEITNWPKLQDLITRFSRNLIEDCITV